MLGAFELDGAPAERRRQAEVSHPHGGQRLRIAANAPALGEHLGRLCDWAELGLRHVLASELLHPGANLRQTQELLGHKHLDSTQRYTRVTAHELRGAVK